MTRRTAPLSLALLLFVVLSPFASAQGEVDRSALNDKALAALRAKNYDEAVGCFEKILAADPTDAGTAYNMACAYSLKGDIEKGFEWLGKSVDLGWGTGVGNLVDNKKQMTHAEMTRNDPDLDNLRKDPRFEKLIERMEQTSERRKAALKKAEEYAAAAAIHIPEKAAGLKEMPLLVVLHGAGSTKDQVVQGRWKSIADELGFALVAPSGKFPTGEDPAKGMTWFENVGEYKLKPFLVERAVNDAVSAFQKEHPLDKTRVAVAGEGIGGVVAMNVAINGPGLYKGAVTVDSPFRADIYSAKAPNAAKMGLKVALLLDPAKLGKDADVAGINKVLQTWGLKGEAKACSAGAEGPEAKKLVVEAIQAVLAPSAAVPAGAPNTVPSSPPK